MATAEVPTATPAWQPLRQPLFRALWIASVASNVGTWMHDAAAGWTMATLTTAPLMVAAMQTATSLPFFLLALPAGALADVLDRRHVLIVTQTWMVGAAAALGGLALAGGLRPWLLLGLTFALGIGAAMTAPAWQAIVPELVERDDLASAVALNGVAMNVARAVGPALGGLLISAMGAGGVFLLNATSFLGVLIVLFRWRRRIEETALPPEDVTSAMRAGLRYVRHATELRTVLARMAFFIVPASAVWALLPIVARTSLHVGAVGYGALLGCLGTGAVACALVLPRATDRLAVDRLLVGATLLFALASATIAVVRVPVLAGAGLLAGGVGWMAMMASLSVAAQRAVPAWVRARALAISLLVIQGGLALGAVLWGVVATNAGLGGALLAAAGLLVVGLPVARRYRLGGLDSLDLTPALHWAQPLVGDQQPDPDEGPVLVTVEYRIDPAHGPDFAAAMRDLGRVRRRDGALRWGLFRDASEPTRWVETFLVASWIEHLRQHERVTQADRAVEARVRAFQLDGPPRVSHLIAERPGPPARR